MLNTDQSYSKLLTAIFCLVMSFFIASPLQAAAQNKVDYFETVRKKLIQDGFSPGKIHQLYNQPQVFFEAEGTAVLFTYSEAKVDYDQFANDWSIDKAKKYMQKYKEDLARTEKAYGVDSHVITAILLVESGLGKSLGKRSALNTLSTLAALMNPAVRSKFWKMIPDTKRPSRKKFEKAAKRRSKWAYNELKAFLKYAFQAGFDPTQISGSFAGAMGLPQFMPSNILAYGKDGNNDGTVDLLTHADSMASIANFLKRHGWRPGISQKKAEKIIYHYNHSKYYVKAILKIATRLK
ncbi:MAG: lytic murein transglycosylase, partial [Desulfobacterales bacterium]|nr:lytic murein transglycosylase [Desulfobacterales bacterium]